MASRYPSVALLVAATMFLAGQGSGQQSVDLFMPGFDTQPLFASIIGEADGVTSYLVGPSPGLDSSEDGLAGQVITYVQGPATAGYTLNVPGVIDVAVGCQIADSQAMCIETVSGDAANDPGTQTIAYDVTFMPAQLADVTAVSNALVDASSVVTLPSSNSPTANPTTPNSVTPASVRTPTPSSSSSDNESSAGLANFPVAIMAIFGSLLAILLS